MKNILNLEGIKEISKAQQGKLVGGWRRFDYCKLSDQKRCCFRIPNGQEICEPGGCSGTRCIYWA